ncbi:hypothetical protein ACHAWF_007367, partial [Thalassiosira exigua]
MELHFVPHMGFKDDETSETDVLARLGREIERRGTVSFGDRTAMPPGGPAVDVLVYNVGIHYSPEKSKKILREFASRVAGPLAARARAGAASRSPDPPRRPTKTVYVTTPAQHYDTPDGQWVRNMDRDQMQCVDRVTSNPRAEAEREILIPGTNVDAVVEYDD